MTIIKNITTLILSDKFNKNFIYLFFNTINLNNFNCSIHFRQRKIFFRTSNVDLFTSIIKQKKFNDSVQDLTIFVDKKNENFFHKIIIENLYKKTKLGYRF